jgi:type I restriction enzyme, S subunit
MKSNQLQKNISNEWKNVRIKDVTFVNRKTLGNDTPGDYKFKYIDLSAVSNRYIDFPTEYIQYKKAPSRARRIAQKGDIIMATVRPNLLGYSLVDFDTSEFVYSTGFAVIENKKDLLNNYFLFSYLFSKKFQDNISNMLVGSSYPAINSSDIENLKINLPPLPEQNRIVSVLETWDKSIENLNKKIELKKQIKKGLMQDLLTGKKRLVGFKDKWEVVTLGDICGIKTGKKDVNEGNPNGKYPFFTCAKEHTYSDNYSFDTEAILIAGNGEVGNCLYYNGKFEAYQRTYILSDFKKESMYIFPYLNYFFQNIINSQKQMGAMPYIKLGMLKEFEIKIPKDLNEQKEIADVLKVVDKEIMELEKKLSIIKEQKKFLLNNLITGVIRTPENLKIN